MVLGGLGHPWVVMLDRTSILASLIDGLGGSRGSGASMAAYA